MAWDFAGLKRRYRNNLLQEVIPFWEKYSIDRDCGGYFSCLDRSGDVFDTDKFLWMQSRQVWTFAMLYRNLEPRSAWLEIARHGAEFLKQYGRDSEGNWYFSLTREGLPLVQPCNWFTDCYAGMGFAQYALASGEEESREIALRTWRNVLGRRGNPKGKYDKTFPGTRPIKALAVPLMLLNLALEMEGILPADELRAMVDDCTREITTQFYDHQRRITWENVAPDGMHLDTFAGRAIIPGHGLEAMWLVLEAVRRHGGDRKTIERAADAIVNLVEFGWDRDYDGILYFVDSLNKPLEKLEWDQKLWWVHLEALVALTMAYAFTGRKDCRKWFDKVHKYTWKHFPDPKYGEWFGYLNRRGKRLLDLKGGKWKGCFHVPRALYLCYREFERMEAEPPVKG